MSIWAMIPSRWTPSTIPLSRLRALAQQPGEDLGAQVALLAATFEDDAPVALPAAQGVDADPQRRCRRPDPDPVLGPFRTFHHRRLLPGQKVPVVEVVQETSR